MRLFVLGSFVQACCWSVARLPNAGETFIANGFAMEAGGKGLNVAIGTHRLGAKVDIALGVGRDYAAKEVLELLEQEGVGTQHVHALAAQSGYGAGLIERGGQNAIAVYPGPNMLLEAQHIEKATKEIRASDMVYAQFETAIPAISQAFTIAKQHGVLTTLNPSPWQPIADALLAATDILIVNEVEACELLKLHRLDFEYGMDVVVAQLGLAAKTLYETWNGRCLVVTLGGEGSVAYTPDGHAAHQPALKVDAVDTVGAGDAFASGFCVAYLQKKSLADALAYGNACGAMVAQQSGVLDALPNAQQLTDFINRHVP